MCCLNLSTIDIDIAKLKKRHFLIAVLYEDLNRFTTCTVAFIKLFCIKE